MLIAQPCETFSLHHSLFKDKKVEASLLLLDRIHPEVSGNKFFKLKYSLQEAKNQGKHTLLTFGGAYSNHIYATAAAAREVGLHAIGLIRGDELDYDNPTLNYARSKGMELHFISRADYREKYSAEFKTNLKNQFGEFFLIPEGGTNKLAIQGTAEILDERHLDYTHICTSVGTGGTFCGLAKPLKKHQTLLGFSSLKGEFIREEVRHLLKNYDIHPKGNIELITAYHFGGYAKWNKDLIDFMHWFFEEFGIILDPIYTSKMLAGFWDLVQKNYFPPNSKVLLLHTGGLQGIEGFSKRTGIPLPTLSR